MYREQKADVLRQFIVKDYRRNMTFLCTQEMEVYWLASSGGHLRFAQAFVVPQIQPFCKIKQKRHPQKLLIKFSALEANAR